MDLELEQWIGLFFVGVVIVVYFLVRRKIRADEQRWTEHRSCDEQTDAERSLSERRW